MTAASFRHRVVVSVLSDVGCRREVNEDSVAFVAPEDAAVLEARGVLVVVADGMGGHAAGEVASRLAVTTLVREYFDAAGDPSAALVAAVSTANRAIHDTAAADPSLHGMGTTCTALVLHGGQASCAHVGDSRLYLVRGGDIYAMTEDHSAVRDLLNQGVITREEAKHHAERNIILRALGTHPHVDIASWSEPLPVRARDCFLLCTDGLHDLVESGELLEACEHRSAEEACRHLVGLARARGGYDNITVAVARLDEPPPAADTASLADADGART
ncbi:MAG TPA: Stp1/IreP family PP2C-type Ser/Thr phosphatase [Vicinamibacterales bacterium]|jgi:protein phosphatase